MRGARKLARRALAVLSGLAVLAAGTLALPIEAWRTGRSGVEQLRLAPAGAHAVDGRRIWVDTDAACGAGRTTDSDDCLALLALLKARAGDVVGISTVFGNASLEVTDRTTKDLISRLAAEGFRVPPVHRGRASAAGADRKPTPAELAIRDALGAGPMAIVALEPLTNIATALRWQPAGFIRNQGHRNAERQKSRCGLLVFDEVEVPEDRAVAKEHGSGSTLDRVKHVAMPLSHDRDHALDPWQANSSSRSVISTP